MASAYPRLELSLVCGQGEGCIKAASRLHQLLVEMLESARATALTVRAHQASSFKVACLRPVHALSSL